MKKYFPTWDRARAEAKKLILRYGLLPLVLYDRKRGEWIVDYKEMETTNESKARTLKKTKAKNV